MNLKSLEIAIGVVFFFTFASLLCSAVRELVEALQNKKGKLLEQALREILNDDQVCVEKNKESILVKFYRHPLIDSLFRQDVVKSLFKTSPLRAIFWNTLPGNIPPKHFAAALLDVLAPAEQRVAGAASSAQAQGQGQNSPPPSPPADPKAARFEEIRTSVLNSVELKSNERLRAAVLWALDHADGDIDKALKSLEVWFENSMVRVTGWYKRKTAGWLFAIGLVTAFALNLDALNVIQKLYIDDEWRHAVADDAERMARDPEFVKRYCLTRDAAPEITPAAGGEDSQGANAQDDKPQRTCMVSNVEVIEKEMREVRLPIGWTEGSWNAFWRDLGLWAKAPSSALPGKETSLSTNKAVRSQPISLGVKTTAEAPASAGAPGKGAENAGNTVFSLLRVSTARGMIVGWLVTAFAMTFGAAFWFDLLGKLVNLRSSLRPTPSTPKEVEQLNP